MEITKIIDFLKAKTGCDEVTPDSDITRDLGVYGDDFDEILSAYSKEFNVDVSGCLWYFHCGEEGSWNSIGGMFFKSPDNQVAHIKITPTMILDFARKGRWDLKYPEHKLPKRRYDMIINQIIVVGALVYLIYKWAS